MHLLKGTQRPRDICMEDPFLLKDPKPVLRAAIPLGTWHHTVSSPQSSLQHHRREWGKKFSVWRDEPENQDLEI